MPPAARLGDPTSHLGVITGPSAPNVLVMGPPAAVVGDVHLCMMPPNAGPHPPSPFSKGSATVFFGGRPALRMGDVAGCGAVIVGGAGTVIVGG